MQGAGAPVIREVYAFERENVYRGVSPRRHFSGHGWFETVHDVLQADWHEDWQDSQFGRSFFQLGMITGTICSPFTRIPLSKSSKFT